MLVAEDHRQDGLGVVQFAVNANEVVPRLLQAMELEKPLPPKPAKVCECRSTAAGSVSSDRVATGLQPFSATALSCVIRQVNMWRSGASDARRGTSPRP